MSRYFGVWRRLANRLSRIERLLGVAGVGEALRHYHETGELPRDPAVRFEIERILWTAEAMAKTIPGPRS